jgi:HSP20 family protein
MSEKQQNALASTITGRDPFARLRQLVSEFERAFDWPSPKWSALGKTLHPDGFWTPRIDVVEREDRLVTKVDLPGVKKEDVSVEVADGQLVLSGERKQESEEKNDGFYRAEREYGSFHRAVPLPEGVKVEDVKATFSNGVLEVSIPLPPRSEVNVRKVRIEDSAGAKSAA